MFEEPAITDPRAESSAVPPLAEKHRLQAALGESFRLQRMLGRGGMGVVHLAFDRQLQRWVAIKTLLPELTHDEQARTRFRREVLTNARLSHPNIVPVHRLVETDDVVASVMRYVPGRSLAYLLWKRERVAPLETCRILAELAGALDYAHRQRVIHRDIKPENILLDDETGRPMIADFGIARSVSLDAMPLHELRAERGMVRGTAQCMAPEQAMGDPDMDGRADLYSLGILGYALLTGTLPFDGDNVLQVVARQISEPLPPIEVRAPEVPRQVARVITRCLAKRADDRWADGAALRDALLDAGVNEVRGSWWQRLRAGRRRGN